MNVNRDTVKQWFFSIPIITRSIFVASFAVTLMANFRLFNANRLVLVWPFVYRHFELWRIVSCFFLHRLGFSFLILMFYLYTYSKALETTHFAQRTSDYAFFVLFSMLVLLATSFFLGFGVLGSPLVMSILYLWSRKFSSTPVSFYFGIQFPGFYLPWALTGFQMLLGGGLPVGNLAGIFAGHAYFFLTEVWPKKGGRMWLSTPQFLFNLFPRNYNQNADQHQHDAREQARHAWGNAYSLQ